MSRRALASNPLNVLHVDDHVIVVAKDAGVLTTPAHGRDGLVDLLDRAYFGRTKVAVVHRLDLLTSGLLVFARTPAAARHLAGQFAAHAVEREYVAVAEGRVADDAGRIGAKIDDKRAVTNFTVTSRGEGTTTLSVRLETGRRNQIRVHLAGLGHPLLGDVRFGAAPWRDRIALHARRLGFVHPSTRKALAFELPPPWT